jgi:uncharacterized protein (DUF2141 family)
MKIYFSFILIFIITSYLSAQDTLSAETETGDLNVIIFGFENSEGTARIGLSNSEELWEMQDTAYRGFIAEIINDSVNVIFENIPFGEYGIKVHHDEDGNNEMNTNFLGIPTENYGFSNNASGTFGQPDWEEAKFIFDSDNKIHTINLEE